MKRICIFLISLLAFTGIYAQQEKKNYFLYPTPPEALTNFYERCNYMTWHFWDNCNLKSAFSSLERMDDSFADFVSLAIHASADTALQSVDRLLKEVGKTPKNLLSLGKMAHRHLYSDSTLYVSEQMYLPFAQAVANCKKIPAEDRKPFARDAKILSSSQEGMIAPDLSFTRPDGSKGKLNDITGKRILLFFNDPENLDSHMSLVRLSADFNLKQLHDKGFLQLVVLYPGKPTEKWENEVSDLPTEWVIGASPEAGEYFELSKLPRVAYLKNDHTILTRDIDSARMIEMLRILNAGAK